MFYRNDSQLDGKDNFISQSYDNLPSTSTELFLNTNSEIKVEMEDEDEILEESTEQNRTPPHDEASIIKSLMEADPTKSIIPICSESAGAQNGEKVLLTMWWTSIGMIHYHFVRGGKPMAEDQFLRHITNMYKKLECKQPGLVSELDVKGLFLLCDNPRPYTSLKSTVRLHQYRFEVLPHPPQSPDLLPSNYHVFRHLNCDLAGKNFYTEAEVERAFLSFIASRKPEFFSDGLTELALRWRKCVSSNGGYFNKS
ncbi:hypothetical protein ANCCAN_14797 [Ancylostoma caninum]|uniref:Transposase n=1 Tax=Ancylostoma caninum TaxID=29170 RepID=A0A368G7I6_ANCCA|nr:hypothetical protein ANCCAN_14797 [Ancylostoma caninum]